MLKSDKHNTLLVAQISLEGDYVTLLIMSGGRHLLSHLGFKSNHSLYLPLSY